MPEAVWFDSGRHGGRFFCGVVAHLRFGGWYVPDWGHVPRARLAPREIIVLGAPRDLSLDRLFADPERSSNLVKRAFAVRAIDDWWGATAAVPSSRGAHSRIG